jgi:eukaryotic-like serine/threonine-protein kinase
MHAMAGTGRVIAGRYRLKEPIGRGAMGTVWRGWDEILDREIAVKELRISDGLPEEERAKAYQRTHREARTAARLSHPGLVTVFDVAEEDGVPWIVMELVHARSLDQIISHDGPLSPPRAAEAGRQLLAALATAHAAGVLHRDVKPSNVLLTEAGRAVLTDFGIATFQGDPRLTQTGMVMGSPGFTAPERIQGNPATPASDLWSLGATLYAAVEGHGPFDRAGGAITTMSAIINTEPPSAPVADGLGAVIDGLLRRNPAERPDGATAARMLGAIGPLPDGSMSAGLYTPTAASYAPVLPRQAQSGSAPGGAAAPGASAAPGAKGALAASPAAAGGAADDAAAAVDGVPGVAEALRARGAAGAGVAEVGGVAGAGGFNGAAGFNGAGGVNVADGSIGIGGPPVAAGTSVAGGPSVADRPSASDGPNGLSADGGTPGAAAVVSGTSVDLPEQDEQGGPAATPSHLSAAAAFAPPVSQDSPPPAAPPAPRSGSAPAGWATPPAPKAARWASTPPAATALPDAAAAAKTAAVPPQPGTVSRGQGGPAGPTGPGGAAGAGRRGKWRRTILIALGAVTVLIAVAVALFLRHSDRQAKLVNGSGATPASTETKARTPVAAIAGTASSGSLPSGWRWYTATAATTGTNAGFKLAIPDSWQLYSKGSGYLFEAPGGDTFLQVDLTPHTKSSMVAEARYLAMLTQRQGKFPGYQDQSIRPVNIRNSPGAAWGFTWQDPELGRVRALDLMYIAPTSAGQQSFALYMSSPDAAFNGNLATFTEEMRTFQPVP